MAVDELLNEKPEATEPIEAIEEASVADISEEDTDDQSSNIPDTEYVDPIDEDYKIQRDNDRGMQCWHDYPEIDLWRKYIF